MRRPRQRELLRRQMNSAPMARLSLPILPLAPAMTPTDAGSSRSAGPASPLGILQPEILSWRARPIPGRLHRRLVVLAPEFSGLALQLAGEHGHHAVGILGAFGRDPDDVADS